MCSKIINIAILLPVIAVVFIFSSAETALGRSMDYDAFLESLSAFGLEFEEAGFYQTGSKVVYVGDERLLIYGHAVTRPDDPPATVSITWEAEVSWFNASSSLRVIYLGEDKKIIAFLNETFRTANDTIIHVTIDGVPVNFPDQTPVIVDGRTLVPVRGVFEDLGFDVSWNENTRMATLRRIVSISGDSSDVPVRFTEEIFITIGSDAFQYNSTLINTPQNHVLDVPAQIINGRTMLPIRAVLESVGYSVEWNTFTRMISITSDVDSMS